MITSAHPQVRVFNKGKKTRGTKRTYNTGYSLVVTDPTTNPALTGLSRGERTGSRVLQWIWSYVLVMRPVLGYILVFSESAPFVAWLMRCVLWYGVHACVVNNTGESRYWRLSPCELRKNTPLSIE